MHDVYVLMPVICHLAGIGDNNWCNCFMYWRSSADLYDMLHDISGKTRARVFMLHWFAESDLMRCRRPVDCMACQPS